MPIINFTYQKTPKTIGGFEIDAFLSETYGFSNTATDIPVEDGSTISDHVTPEAPQISVEAFIGKTKFEPWEGDIPENEADLPSVFDEDPKARIKQSYHELRRLMDDREPLTVELGLDTFDNMVITSFDISRDVETGADLTFSMTFKQVRIIKSESTTVNSSQGGGDQFAGTANGGVVGTKKVDQKNNVMHEQWRVALKNNRCTQGEYLEVCKRNGWTP